MSPLVAAAVITGLFTFTGIIYANFASKKRTELKAKVVEVENQALNRAELVRIQSETETKRIDQGMDIMQKLLDRQDVTLVSQGRQIEILQQDMKACIEERAKFAALDADKTIELQKLHTYYNALEAQLRNTKKYQELKDTDKVIVEDRRNK